MNSGQDLTSNRRSAAETSHLKSEISELKQELNATIVAHNYQLPEVQDIADFVGDSLELSRKCAEVKSPVIVFCGVDFMAETAVILNPEATVLLPVTTACCPMSAMIDEKKLEEWKAKYSEALVVAYVNSSAAVKAGSYICCTSANAVKIVNSVPSDEVLFIPDRNLGQYVARKTKKKVITYPGYCVTHNRLTADEVAQAKKCYPDAEVIVHPECRSEVVDLADAVLSTSQMLKYVRESPARTFLIGTEQGILHRMHLENPDKKFFTISPSLICVNMKKTRLETVLEAMQKKENKVVVPEDIRLKARQALDRMLAVS